MTEQNLSRQDRYAALADDLATRRAQHLLRERRVVAGPQGITLVIGGKSYLNFCSNDYLGHANHPLVREAFQRGIDQYGVGSGAAHLVNGHSAAHHALEEELAEFSGRPRALLFSTGYMANLGVISALCGRGDSVFEDRLNHASLLDGALLAGARLQRYQHASAGDLNNKLSASHARTRMVVSDGVFSMDGDSAPIADLARVSERQNAWLMIDDAHGFGVLGNNGRGSLEDQSITIEQVPILMATLGKGLGTFGAFVAGEAVLIETLIQRARSYIYTTAMPSAVAEATRASLRLTQSEAWRRDALRERIQQFRLGAEQLGLPLMPSASPIQPLLIGTSEAAMDLSQALEAEGFLISAIRPPTVPEGTARLRITLSAEHQEQQVEQLLDALVRVLRSHSVVGVGQ